MRKPARWLLVAGVALATTAGDALSKQWALHNLQPGVSKPFLPGLLQLTLTTNTGGAFGLGRGNPLVMTLVAVSIFLAILVWLVLRERGDDRPGTPELCGLSLVLGGALGNLLDRFCRGEVTDFLEFMFISFPIFNFADAMIDVGAGLVILSSLAKRPVASSGADAACADAENNNAG